MLCSLSFFIFGLKIDKIMTLTKKSPQTDVNSAMSSSFARGAENICGTGKCGTGKCRSWNENNKDHIYARLTDTKSRPLYVFGKINNKAYNNTSWQSAVHRISRPFLFCVYRCGYKNGKRVSLVPHSNKHGVTFIQQGVNHFGTVYCFSSVWRILK